jgi:DNA helicase II / ATP-dependent DNA helicase PcrA
MSQWDLLRQFARQQHDELFFLAQDDSAFALVHAAQQITGIKMVPVDPRDPLLGGAEAVLDPELKRIWYSSTVDSQILSFYQAHEYAHYWLGHSHSVCGANDVNGEAPGESFLSSVQRIEGYGSRERRECQSNVFARELLLPSDKLRRWFVQEKQSADAIARRVGLPKGIVFQQLTDVILMPELAATLTEQSNDQLIGMDSTQLLAAEHLGGPLLVDAGPGTGKTRTLAHRIVFLLEEKQVNPEEILALTFSNKAAEEMRERVARRYPALAHQIWMGTFHSFGLELLRKYGDHLGFPPSPKVLDPADSLFMLEGLLSKLNLHHYLNLHEPTAHFWDVLRAISRAKDELVGPAHYQELAETQLQQAKTDEEVLAAEKALEVAHIYAVYQECLDREHVLDFGDLISKSVLLLREHPEVHAEVAKGYSHILVDEYQDVNRASGLLLRELVVQGAKLWVVGDIRQSIYRFRGASPTNLRLFGEDFLNGQVTRLNRNYRSQPGVVRAISHLARNMKIGPGSSFESWEVNRQDKGGRILMEVADDLDAECAGITQEIERQHKGGIPYRQQAILCRSHTMLSRIAERLEQAGVPILYLGDLFERPEIRDLLSLISLAAKDSNGLLRAARFSEYDIPLDDVRIVIRLAQEKQTHPLKILFTPTRPDGISVKGWDGLQCLWRHLDGIFLGKCAWETLANYLFDRSEYLRSILADQTVWGQQKRLALHQLLQFAYEHRRRPAEPNKDPKCSFLDYIRQLERLGEETQLGSFPQWADDIDAVRMLTVHASKGLEFSAVYVPYLGKRFFPSSRKFQPCPPPLNLLPEGSDDHDAEEECLFFVAISRARDTLCLSRANRYGATGSNSSDLLKLLKPVLPGDPEGVVTWKGRTNSSSREKELVLPPPQDLPLYEVEALDQYALCPRQYFYASVLDLSAKRDLTAYLKFRRCIRQVLRWAQEQGVNIPEAYRKLAELWSSSGPVGHAYEAFYSKLAQEMLERALQAHLGSKGKISAMTLEVPLTFGRIRFTPDQIDIMEDGTQVIQRLRSGRVRDSEANDERYALYHYYSQNHNNNAQSHVQALSLLTGDVKDITLSPSQIKTHLKKYDAAMAGIRANLFAPKPDSRLCSLCPYYFICPKAEDP